MVYKSHQNPLVATMDTLFLDSAGDKIGIATTDSQQILNVVGDINFTGNLSLRSANPDYRFTIKPNNNND